MRQLFVLIGLFAATALQADIVSCSCDPTHPETLKARECGLCREAEKQPASTVIFVLKDINPTKPGRWLILPRQHERSIEQLPAEIRAQLWARAITEAKARFGDDWGIAYNAPSVQTQCHVHLHIGRLIPGVETNNFITVTKIEDIPPPPPGEGIWVHPQGNLFHVHGGEQITETVLVR